MNDEPKKTFVEGIRFFKPRDGAPDFVKGRISIEPEKLVAWLKENKEHMRNGYFPIDMKLSRDGKIYFELDTWKPEEKKPETDWPEEAPF